MLQEGQNRDLQARDDQANRMRRLSDQIRAEQNPTELRNLKNRLADSLSQMHNQQHASLDRRLERLAGDLRQESDPDRIRELNHEVSRLAEQLTGELRDQDLMLQEGQNRDLQARDDQANRMRRLSDQIRAEQDPKAFRKLQQEIVDITEQVLNRSIPLKQAPKALEDPLEIEAINNRIQSLASKLLGDEQLDQMQDTANQLSELSRKMLEKMTSADLLGKEPTAAPQKQQQEFLKLISSIEDLMSRMPKTENTDSIVENSRQLAKLAQQMKYFNPGRVRNYQRETSQQRQPRDPAQQNLIDTSLRVQWLSNKLQKENDPETNQSYQKQLVELSKQMTDSMKKVFLDASASSSDDNLQTQQEKEISTQVLQLSRRLKKVDDSAELVEISKRMDRLANRLVTRKENRLAPSNSYRGRSNENRSLARTKDRDLNQKAAFHKVPQTDDVKYLGREPQEKAALAIKKIEKTIEKLKAYNSSDSSLWKNSNTAPKGKSSIGSGSSQRPLPMANRFLAERVAKETSRTPDTGPIRNVLPMKQDLYRDDVFERVIRRLENHKKRIKQLGEDNLVVKNVPLKDYSNIKEPRKLSKQPPGLENIRYVEKEPAVVPAKKVEDKTVTEKTVSYMDKNQQFLTSRLKGVDKELLEMIPEREIKTKKNKSARLSSSPVTNDSVIENTIPPDYQSIFKRLFSNEIDFNNEL
jgi:hypothetical protein